MPLAAPSRPELVHYVEPDSIFSAVEDCEPAIAQPAPPIPPSVIPQSIAVSSYAADAIRAAKPRSAVLEPKKSAAQTQDAGSSTIDQRIITPPPRFALQLLRAGNCLLLVELPTGDSFQSRDPAYLLLKDMLRAARLPDDPKQVGDGEPIRWPLLHRGSLEQGADAARDYVQGVLAAELEEMGCACLWLVGLPALRFAGEVEMDACYRELNIEGIGLALTMPGLEELMEQPTRKAKLWEAIRRSMSRWVTGL